MKLIGEFELSGLPKTINAGGRMHWAVKVKEVNKWKALVANACYKLGISELRLDRAVLTFTRHSAQEPDFDNLVSSFKSVQDGLIYAGVIVNDKMSNIGVPTYRWERAKARAGKISVRIEAVEKEVSA